MLRFNDIADRVLEYNPACDIALLQRAYVYTAKVHDGQERLSREPYLVHPLEVAGILVDMRMDEVCVAAGLLHDTVEDTLSTLGEIDRLFGGEVAFLVEGLTKIAKIEFTSVRERQAEPRTSARCCSRCRRTFASCSSSSRIASTTCGRSRTCPRIRDSASPRRPSTSTPRWPIAWGSTG
jgi:hypothetical protein